MIAENDINHTVVYDIGSGTTQVGFAGEAQPMYSIPSIAAVNQIGTEIIYGFENSALFRTSPTPELVHIFDGDYNFTGSEVLSHLLNASHERLNIINPSEHIALFSMPAYFLQSDNSGQAMAWVKTLAEIAFETFEYRSICISPDALLASYAHCFQTCTVVDFGWSATRVIPVIEGKINESAVKLHPIGGFALTQLFLQQMQARHITLTSPDEFSPEQKEIYDRNAVLDILQQNCTFAADPTDADFCGFINGTRQIDLRSEMTLLSALHWTGTQTRQNQTENGQNANNQNEENQNDQSGFRPIQELVEDAISSSPMKSTLWQNIVTSGGFSALDSYIDRLQMEIANHVKKGGIKPRVHFPMNKMNGGAWTVWTGGSILGSSNIFPHFCVEKHEWEENGEEILRVKYLH